MQQEDKSYSLAKVSRTDIISKFKIQKNKVAAHKLKS